MILGAGIYQVPLICQAKKMGLYTIVASIPGNYPGFAYADKVLYLDTTDQEALLAAAKAEKVSGVVVCGTDVCVPAQGYVCQMLGLPGPGYAAALRAQKKSLMKEAFQKAGVRTARFVSVSLSEAHPETVCERLGYPVIFKCVDSSGSRGITKVTKPEEIHYAVSQIRKVTRSDHYLVEEFLEGKEFGAEAFISQGTIQFVQPHGKYVYRGESGVPMGHYFPCDITEEAAEDAIRQVSAAITALGIDNCAVNADLMLSNGKCYVLEIGARAGATCLPEMIGLYYGFNYYEKIIQAALGQPLNFAPGNSCRQPNAAMLICAEKTGTICNMQMPAALPECIENFQLDYTVGDAVRKFEKGPDRIGQIIARGSSAEQAKRCIDETLAKLTICISEGTREGEQ